MKTPYLLGIITVLLFGSFALSGFLAEAGPEPNEVTRELGNVVQLFGGFGSDVSIAICPITHKVIGGGIEQILVDASPDDDIQYRVINTPDFPNNAWRMQVDLESVDMGITARGYAMCQKINFPMMGMIGGELLDLDTMSLFIGAIGVNPVITGLVAITMGGVAAQAIWFVNSRRVKKNE